jgi:antitoxin (DNA-binding transcriptional repressor) of toxin-antitoxin stability system
VRRIDAAHLPDEVVGLLAALAPGESLTVLRDGEPIATITGVSGSGPLEGRVIRPSTPRDADPSPQSGGHSGGHSDGCRGGDSGDSHHPGRSPHAGVTVVVTAMELSESARGLLSAELGSDYVVLDLDTAPKTAEVLLVPPISLQLLGSLRARFPAARVVVAEFEDPELGVDYRGPVQRMIDAGAEVYLASTTLPRLAVQLDRAVTRRAGLTAGSRHDYPRLEIGPPA